MLPSSSMTWKINDTHTIRRATPENGTNTHFKSKTKKSVLFFRHQLFLPLVFIFIYFRSSWIRTFALFDAIISKWKYFFFYLLTSLFSFKTFKTQCAISILFVQSTEMFNIATSLMVGGGVTAASTAHFNSNKLLSSFFNFS